MGPLLNFKKLAWLVVSVVEPPISADGQNPPYTQENSKNRNSPKKSCNNDILMDLTYLDANSTLAPTDKIKGSVSLRIYCSRAIEYVPLYGNR